MAITRVRLTLPPLIFVVLLLVGGAFADANFEKLFAAKKYKEALEYADENIPMDKRTPPIWVRIGQANEALDYVERALACYMVAWRTKPDEYQALLGVARVYNKMEQPADALSMAENALKVNFTAEASWEYAKACIALKKPADAKKAFEKVIAVDTSNVIANRELGNIYYNDGEFAKAIPLIKRSYRQKADGAVAFSIGRSYVEAGVPDSALAYLKLAVDQKFNVSEASLYMARAQYGLKKYGDAVAAYSKVNKNQMAAMDYYILGFSNEKGANAAAALAAYQTAVPLFKDDKGKEALLSRACVARAHIGKKEASAALPHLLFIAKNDDKAAVVNDLYFMLAEAYVQAKDNAKAISSLEKAIAINSKNVEAYMRLGELYEATGQSERAKKTYELMMSISPNDPSVYVMLGKYSIKSQKWKEAMAHFEKSNGLQRSGDAFEGIAVAAVGMGNMPKALEAAKAAIALDPNLTDARAALAYVLIANKQFKEAQAQAEFLCKKESSNLDYLKMLATCYENNKELAKLAETDRQIASIDRKDTESRLRLAAYAESKNDAETAIAMYNEITEINPKHLECYKRLSVLYRGQKQLPEALAAIKKFIEQSPNDAEAHRDMGDILYEQKNLDAALTSYRTAVKLDPALKGFHKRYAEIVIAKGQTAEVITALNGVIKNGDAEIGTYTTLGLIYQGKKQYREAMEMYTKALVLEPSNFDALIALGACQAAAGDVSSAIITYEQSVMMNPNAGAEYKELGDLYTKQKKGAEALRAYIKYLDKTPSDKNVAAIAGRLLYEEKNYADAAKYLSLSASTEPDVLVMYADANLRISNGLKNALAALEDLRNRKPPPANITRVFQLLGDAYEKDGRPEKAAQAYSEYVAQSGVKDSEAAYKSAFLQEKSNPNAAIKIYEANMKTYPNDIRNFLRLGLLYSQKRETLPKALPLLQKCAQAADTMPQVWLEIAKVYGALNQDDKELEAYRKYARTDPQHVEANKRLGTLLMRKGDFTTAMVNLEIAAAMSPNDAEIMALLARGYMRTKRGKEATDMLTKAKTLKPDDADIRYQLYEVYTQTGQSQKAFDEIKQLAELKKEGRYMLLYGEALVAQNKIKDAEKVVDDLLSDDPDNTDALMLSAKILRARKNWDEAIDIYKQISDIHPDMAAAYYERAETFMQSSKPTWAETFYKRALRADPQYGLAELGLAKLYKTRKQMDLYKKHLESAQQMSPDNSQIIEEAARANAGK
jgi:tetratricopeptide (TPR) repeat protein